MGWDMMRLWLPSQKCRATCDLPSVGHGIKCDEIAWQKKNVTWHSLAVCGHGMKHDETAWQEKRMQHTHWLLIMDERWWDCLAKEKMGCSVTHILLVMGWEMMRVSGRKKMQVTHPLLVMGWNMMRMPGKGEWQYHSPSQAAGHGMRKLGKRKMQCHSHDPIGQRMRGDETTMKIADMTLSVRMRDDEIAMQKRNAVSLTTLCWSWDEIWWYS